MPTLSVRVIAARKLNAADANGMLLLLLLVVARVWSGWGEPPEPESHAILVLGQLVAVVALT